MVICEEPGCTNPVVCTNPDCTGSCSDAQFWLSFSIGVVLGAVTGGISGVLMKMIFNKMKTIKR